MRFPDMIIASLLLACTPWSVMGSLPSPAPVATTGITGNGERFDTTNSNNILRRPEDSSLRAGHIDREKTRGKTAVIVGAGPGGLAAALVLSEVKRQGKDTEEPLFERVIVLDERPKEKFDPTRAYGFSITKRGQKFTEAFEIDLSERGCAQTGIVKSVPSDPKEVYDPTTAIPFMSEEQRRKRGTSYTIPRHDMLLLLEDKIKSGNKALKKNRKALVELRREARCEHIEPTEDGLVKVVLNGGNEGIIADFCVGADGIRSSVRRSLEDGRFDPEKWTNAKNPSKTFKLKKYNSPSTGMRVQNLRVDPNFGIPKGGMKADRKRQLPLDKRVFKYNLLSTTTGRNDKFNLSILPQKDPRTARARVLYIVNEPTHDLWNPQKVSTDDGGQSVKEFFEKTHPRYNWNKLVKKKEWERLASGSGLSFPPCQYVPSMYVSSNPNYSDDNVGAGVILLGDALHAFPPDIGMGVNKALGDCMMLKEAFEYASAADIVTPDSFMTRALKHYQEQNGPEVKALIQMSVIGAPFQYGQPWTFSKFLWFANFTMRMSLNKLTRGFSPPVAVILSSTNPDMTFHEVMKKVNTLTAVLWSSFFLILLSFIRMVL